MSERALSSSPRSCSGERSEEHTSELQSQSNLVCRLLLEKKKAYVQTLPFNLDHSYRSSLTLHSDTSTKIPWPYQVALQRFYTIKYSAVGSVHVSVPTHRY